MSLCCVLPLAPFPFGFFHLVHAWLAFALGPAPCQLEDQFIPIDPRHLQVSVEISTLFHSLCLVSDIRGRRKKKERGLFLIRTAAAQQSSARSLRLCKFISG